MRTSKNRYADALFKFFLVCVFIHISLLAIYFAVTLDITYLNLFNILDFDLFFPEIAHGMLSQVLSVLAIVYLYFMVYVFFTKR